MNIRLKASFTIEASYIMPMAFALLLLTGLTAMWLCDRDLAYFNALAIAKYGEEEELFDYAPEGTVTGYGAAHAGDCILMDNGTSVSVTKNTKKIKVSIEGSCIIPFSGWIQGFGWETFSGISVTKKEKILRPCALIRKVREVNELMGD